MRRDFIEVERRAVGTEQIMPDRGRMKSGKKRITFATKTEGLVVFELLI